MSAIEILSVCTGVLTGNEHKEVILKSLFKADEFPYTIDFCAAATIAFTGTDPAFDIRFDIFDGKGEPISSDLHYLDPDIFRSAISDAGVGTFYLAMTPKDHIIKSEGTYKVTVSIVSEDVFITSKEAFFLVSRSWQEVYL